MGLPDERASAPIATNTTRWWTSVASEKASDDGAGGAKANRRPRVASPKIGVLGWVIVTPMLIGVFIGRWLDRTFASGIFWTAPLLMVGVGDRLRGRRGNGSNAQ